MSALAPFLLPVICLGAGRETEQSQAIVELNRYAELLETYYLDRVLSNGRGAMPPRESQKPDYKLFSELLNHLDSLTPNAVEACAEFLVSHVGEAVDRKPKEPSPGHTALLLTALFHSMEPGHLPVIAAYMNDDRIVHDYATGSPETRAYWHVAHPLGGASRREVLRVQDISRHFLRMWGFRAVHITIREIEGDPVPYVDPRDFEAFWRPENNVPGTATTLWIRSSRARDRVTGEVDRKKIAELYEQLDAYCSTDQFILACASLLYRFPPPEETPPFDIVELSRQFPKTLATSILQSDETTPLLHNHGDLVAFLPHEAEALESGLIDKTKDRFDALFKTHPNFRFFLAFRVLDFDGTNTRGGYRPSFSGLERPFYVNVVRVIIALGPELFTHEEFSTVMKQASAPARTIWLRQRRNTRGTR